MAVRTAFLAFEPDDPLAWPYLGGGARCRAPHLGDAVERATVLAVEKSLRVNSKPGVAVVNWLWLALANVRFGKSEDARRWLNKAQA
jgi:hypothetical protein